MFHAFSTTFSQAGWDLIQNNNNINYEKESKENPEWENLLSTRKTYNKILTL